MDIVNIVYSSLSLGGLGLLFGIGLGFASKKFAVEADERIALVRAALPGANCGGCGYPGCDACANAIVEGKAGADACPVGGIKSAQEIAGILGIEVEIKENRKAFIKCSGTEECRKFKNYSEYKNCHEALQARDLKDCRYGCIGLGDCKNVCKFGAINIINGIACVDEKKCTGCGSCIKTCPKAIIELVPSINKIRVQCSSKDAGKIVRTACNGGCIGCGLCVKACEYGAVAVVDNLAVIDYVRCTQCGKCIKSCPSKVIKSLVEKENLFLS